MGRLGSYRKYVIALNGVAATAFIGVPSSRKGKTRRWRDRNDTSVLGFKDETAEEGDCCGW